MCQRASLYRPGEERGERKEGKGEREDGYGWGERRRTEENSEHSVCFRKGSAAPQRRTHPRTMSYVKGTFCQAGSSRRPSMLMWGVADTPDADAVGEGSLRATYLRRRRRVRYESPSSTATVHGHKVNCHCHCHYQWPHNHCQWLHNHVRRTARLAHSTIPCEDNIHNTHSSPSTRTGKGTDRACASRRRRGHFRRPPRRPRGRAERGRGRS